MPFVIYLAALFVLLMAGGVWFILRYQRARRKKLEDKIFYIKTFGKQIVVPLASCNIVHRGFEDEKYGKADVCLVTYETEIKEKKVLFKSQPFYISPQELQSLMARHKNGQVYYDVDNWKHHYFELVFLSSYTR